MKCESCKEKEAVDYTFINGYRVYLCRACYKRTRKEREK